MKSHVSKITIGRLYNLGNYEHIRYELTVDVAPGEAGKAIVAAENLIAALNPKQPVGVTSRKVLAAGQAKIDEVKAMSDDEVARRHNRSKAVAIHELEQQYSEQLRLLILWETRQAWARKLFDDLGGASELKDAKQDWDDFDTEW